MNRSILSIVNTFTMFVLLGASFVPLAFATTGDSSTPARCEDYGYDFQVAKFEWGNNSYSLESIKSGYSVNISGDTDTANWSTNPAVDGVIAKAGTTKTEFPGGTNGTLFKADIGSGQNGISHVVFCGNEADPEPEPVYGCTDEDASNYNPDADTDDGSCEYQQTVCENGNVSTTLTAYEDSYFTVKFTNNNDCEKDLGASSYLVPVHESGNICHGEYLGCQKRVDFEDFTLAPHTVKEVTVEKPNKCYQIDWYFGTSIETFDPDNGVTYNGENRFIDARFNASVEDCQDEPPTPVTPVCTFKASATTFPAGQSTTLSWTTQNTDRVVIDKGIGEVVANGSVEVTPLEDTTYTLTAYRGSTAVSCKVTVQPTPDQPVAPTCPLTTKVGRTIVQFDYEKIFTDRGEEQARTTVKNLNLAAGKYDITLVSWDGYNGRENNDQPHEQYLLEFLNNGTVVSISPAISDLEDLVRSATKQEVVAQGFVLNSAVTGVRAVQPFYPDTSSANSLHPICAAIDEVVEQSVPGCTDPDATNYNPAATTDDGSCEYPQPEVFTCANNVTFRASDNSITRGDNTTLTWNVTDADSVNISTINATDFSGSQTVSPSGDITYTLTATKGSASINCPVAINVSSGGGGGGGGSASPRCELDISDTRITLGEAITLTWDTSRATEVALTDDRGKVLFTTDDYLARDKEDYYDGEITLRPTRDTEYTLIAERGRKDDECSVEVEVEDTIVVLETREPLVAGIALSEVPYTGFEAGPMLTVMFYALLVAWAFYISYLLVVRRNSAQYAGEAIFEPTANEVAMKQAEENYPDLFVKSVVAEPQQSTIPDNLPTQQPTVGFGNEADEVFNPHHATESVIADIENHAHAQYALLSSDAVRHFVATTETTGERHAALDQVIDQAKGQYPLEDGWVVINEARMRELCEVCKINAAEPKAETFVPSVVPEGSSSLAEAIVTGNVVAAYEMIGNRPMFSLADAAADLDAVYRGRKGEVTTISDLLARETTTLSDDQIKNMIAALTSALDGTYTDEASAVKMAIMKAVKEAA